MELNAERHFANVPTTFIDHSVMPIPYDWTFTINSGVLNCFYVDEAIPGDIYDLETKHLTRQLTPITSPLDVAFLDVYYFFVPWRLVWIHSKEFFGENTSTAWSQTTPAPLPSVNTKGWTRTPGDLLNQLGITVKPFQSDANCTINSLPMRSYNLIWREFFRDQNTMNYTYAPVNTADSGDTAAACNTLLPVCRIHDLFGSVLPGPQRAAGGFSQGVALALEGILPVGALTSNWSEAVLNEVAGGSVGVYPSLKVGIPGSTSSISGNLQVNAGTATYTGGSAGSSAVTVKNLGADASYGQIDINAFRMAFQTQKVLEALARGGSRYTEILQSIYGTRSDDARLQRPEFLGGQRWNLNMQDNLQTSQTATTPLGTIGGYSKTLGKGARVRYPVKEHGYVMGVCCIRHNRSYCQMIPQMFRRTNFFSIYNPKFAHLGEQPVMVSEICADYAAGQGNIQDPSKVIFGYQEYGYSYRWKPSLCGGGMSPGSQVDPVTGDPTGLGSVWTYADWYKSAPSLSAGWMSEGQDEIGCTLAVQNADQYICQISVFNKHVRPMPVYSVPGFVDHF